MLTGIRLEKAVGETRVVVTPETAMKFVAQGRALRVETAVIDAAYEAVGCEIRDRAGTFVAERVLKVRSPSTEEPRNETPHSHGGHSPLP